MRIKIEDAPPPHPEASIFPVMDDEELVSLAEDIKHNGLRRPLTVWRDETGSLLLLDGRNRMAACAIVGVDLTFSLFSGADPLAEIIALNLQRKHLTKSQRAMASARVMDLYRKRAQERMRLGLPQTYRSDARDAAGRDFHVSGSLVQRANVILDSRDGALIDAVDRGRKTVSAAYSEVRCRPSALVRDLAQSAQSTSRRQVLGAAETLRSSFDHEISTLRAAGHNELVGQLERLSESTSSVFSDALEQFAAEEEGGQ